MDTLSASVMTSTAQQPASGKPSVCLITPVFNEAENLPRFKECLDNFFFKSPITDYSVIFVDDGSTDSSWAKLVEMCAGEPRCRAIRLSRNFGAHAAISAGMENSSADAAVVFACDLQDPPETVVEFVEKWRNGADIVFGHRSTRKDGKLRQWCSSIFQQLLGRFAMPQGSQFATGSFLLADQKVIQAFREFREYHCITFALFAWTGFSQEKVEYHRAKRQAGKSGWSLGRMMKAFYSAFIAFSHLPIRLITILSIITFILSFSLATYAVFSFLVSGSLPGWASTMVVLGFFFGIQFFVLSVIGEYLHRIYFEIVARPRFFVAADTRCPKPPAANA